MDGVIQFGGGGGAILDQPYGPLWATDVTLGRSAKSLYDKIQTIGAGFSNTAYVRPTGNDSTGTVGNYLLPFLTPGAAITALGTLTGSLLFIDAGNYSMNDSNAPYGMKAPGSHYDIYCSIGVTITYSGTYGFFQYDGLGQGTSGNIYGYGNFINLSTSTTKTVDGVGNYAFNYNAAPGISNFEFSTFFSNATSGSMGLIRIGSAGGATGAANMSIRTRVYCRTGVTMLVDTGSRFSLTGNVVGTLDSVGDGGGQTNYALQINNPITASFYDIGISSRGTAFSNNNTKCISINNSGNFSIKFLRVSPQCIQAPAGYALINIEAGGSAVMDNFLIKNCELRNRQNTTFTKAGNCIVSPFNVSLKIIDTYADTNTGGAGIINNLISNGNMFMYEPNL